MTFRKIFRKAKNTVYLYISQIIEKILYLVLLVFTSRYLGAAGLGQYASSFAIVGIFFIFVNGGFDNLLIREISIDKQKIEDWFLNLVILKCFLGCIVFLVILYLSNMAGAFDDIKGIVLILALAGLIGSMNQVFYCILVAYEKMKYIMIISIAANMVTVGLGVIFLISGKTLLYVAGSFFAGSVISFIFGAFFMLKAGINPVFKINFSAMPDFIKRNMPFLLASIFPIMLFKIDIILLKLFKGNEAVGLYRAAYSFLTNFEAFPGFFMMALYPKFSRLMARNKDLFVKVYKKSFFYLLLLNIFMLGGIFIFGKILILAVFGKGFMESVAILRYAAIAIFFLFQNMCNVYFLNAVNMPGLNAAVFCLGVVINLVLDLIFIPIYGCYGVLIAIGITYPMIFVMSGFIINKKILHGYARLS